MLTPAGRKILNRYIERESRNDFMAFRNGRGDVLRGMPLTMGDGSELAAARKLVRDGYATLTGGWGNHNRCFNITEAGRKAMDL